VGVSLPRHDHGRCPHNLQLEEILHLHEELTVVQLVVPERLLSILCKPIPALIEIVIRLNVVGRANIKERKGSELIGDEWVKHPGVTEIVVLREQP
jgi:hypothetical protein